MRYDKVPKRKRNAITARIESTVEKYGFETTRAVINRYFNSELSKQTLETEIKDKEKELQELRKKR